MDQVAYDKFTDRLVRRQTLLYLKKNADYGDSYTNTLDKRGIVAFEVVADFKLDRLRTLIKADHAEVAESKKDTVLDLFNYAVMTYSWERRHIGLLGIVENMYFFLSEDFRHFLGYLTEKGLLFSKDSSDIELVRQIKQILSAELEREA